MTSKEIAEAAEVLNGLGVDRACAMRHAESIADDQIALMYPDTGKMVARLHRGRIISKEFRSMVHPISFSANRG